MMHVKCESIRSLDGGLRKSVTVHANDSIVLFVDTFRSACYGKTSAESIVGVLNKMSVLRATVDNGVARLTITDGSHPATITADAGCGIGDTYCVLMDAAASLDNPLVSEAFTDEENASIKKFSKDLSEAMNASLNATQDKK